MTDFNGAQDCTRRGVAPLARSARERVSPTNDATMNDRQFRPGSGAGISRRTFLYSIGALALSACGSTESTGNAGGIATAAAGNRALARVATDTATVATHEAFAHPGLLHTQADFDRIARKI